MRKYLLLLALFAASCTTAPITTVDEVVTVEPSGAPVSPPLEGKFEYVLGATVPSELSAKILAATKIVVDRLKSAAFRDKFLKLKVDILQNNPSDYVKKNIKMNEDAYKHLITASAKVKVEFYYKRFTSAVAYRDGDTVYFNGSKVWGWSEVEFASTLLHETTHVLGYDHYFNNVPERASSLPYTMNSILESL